MRFRLIVLLFGMSFFSLTSEADPQGQTSNWVKESGVKRLVYQAESVKDILDVGRSYETRILNSDIYIVDGLKLKARRLTYNGQYPLLSWNGEKVAFLGFCKSNFIRCTQLQVMNVDGSEKKTITNLPLEVNAFAWSPVDDTLVYFERPKLNGHLKVVLIRADGSGRKELAEVLDQCGGSSSLTFLLPQIDWSPDGNRLAFPACSNGQHTIVTVNRDGNDAKAVVNGYDARWSPDGKQLLYRYASESSPIMPSIWVANADGTQARKVLDGESANYGLTWFPDGKSIAFASKRENPEQSEIFRIQIDGTGLEKIASGKGVSYSFPIASPDGTRLFVDGVSSRQFQAEVTYDFGIWLVDLASHQQERLIKGNHAGIFWGQK